MRTTIFAMMLPAATVTACATQHVKVPADSGRRVIGPKGYTVDWDLPETGTYWVPKEREGAIKAASEACNAPIGVFIYHQPRRNRRSGALSRIAADRDAKAFFCEKVQACVFTRRGP